MERYYISSRILKRKDAPRFRPHQRFPKWLVDCPGITKDEAWAFARLLARKNIVAIKRAQTTPLRTDLYSVPMAFPDARRYVSVPLDPQYVNPNIPPHWSRDSTLPYRTRAKIFSYLNHMRRYTLVKNRFECTCGSLLTEPWPSMSRDHVEHHDIPRCRKCSPLVCEACKCVAYDSRFPDEPPVHECPYEEEGLLVQVQEVDSDEETMEDSVSYEDMDVLPLDEPDPASILGQFLRRAMEYPGDTSTVTTETFRAYAKRHGVVYELTQKSPFDYHGIGRLPSHVCVAVRVARDACFNDSNHMFPVPSKEEEQRDVWLYDMVQGHALMQVKEEEFQQAFSPYLPFYIQ
jgi:hypothetical protein